MGRNLGSVEICLQVASDSTLDMQASSALTDRDMNPKLFFTVTTPKRPPSDPCPDWGSLPAVGFRLAMPENMAGILTLPARSEPVIIL